MIVKIQKPIEFINECNCIVDLDELEKAIVWYSKNPVARLRKIYMYGCYPAVSIYHEKIHVHRLLMMYWEKRKLNQYEYVHHKDENKLDARKENLEIIAVSEHQSLHNRGKKLTKSHRKKIGEANRKRKGDYHLDIPLEKIGHLLASGWSKRRIARYFGCDSKTIDKRIRRNPHLLEVIT